MSLQRVSGTAEKNTEVERNGREQKGFRFSLFQEEMSSGDTGKGKSFLCCKENSKKRKKGID